MKKSRGRYCPRVESLESRICMSFGGLDPAFGNAGMIHFENQQTVDSLDKVYGIVALADNSLVVSGTSEAGRGPVLSFAKLDDQGQPDPAFGSGGLVLMPFDLDAPQVVADSGGDLFVAGNRFVEGELKYLVLKINSDGSLNGGFAGLGYRDFAADGRILALEDGVAVLTRDEALPTQYRITKLEGDGTLDDGFGTLGVSVPIPEPGNLSVSDPPQFIRDEQGRYYVATQVESNGTDQLHVTRLTPAGDIDLSFGAGGVLADDVEVGDGWTIVVEQGGGGATLVVWQESDQVQTTVFARRILADGMADVAFGTNGLLTSPQLSGAFNFSYERSPLVVATGSGETTVLLSLEDFFREFRFYSLVIGADGQWDLSHGVQGVGVSDNQEFRYLDAVTPVVASDGDLRVAAWGYDTSQQPIVDWRVLGVTGDGNTDAAFGTDGLSSVDFTGPSSYVDTFDLALTKHSLAVLQSPRIQRAEVPRPALGTGLLTVVRRNGQLNTEHASEGTIELDSAVMDESFGWAVTREGNFVTATVTPDENQGLYPAVLTLQKRLPSGDLDTSFGNSGAVTLPTHGTAAGLRPRVLTVSDGTLYVVMQTDDESQPGWIAKFSAAGQLLTAFGDNGILEFEPTAQEVVDAAASKTGVYLLVADAGHPAGTARIQIKAFDQNGDAKTSFGDQGVYLSDVPEGSQLARIAQDDAGRLLVLYRSGLGLRLHRVTEAGQLDTGFGTQGEVLLSSQVQTEVPHADLCLFGNEPVVAATTGLFNENSSVFKLLETGAWDTSFGQGGSVTLDLSQFAERVRDVVVLPDASVLLGVRTLDAVNAFGVVVKLSGRNPSPKPLHNVYHPLNTNRPDDDVVSARDALVVIFYLNNRNTFPPGAGPDVVGYVDVNGDGFVSPSDALLVISALNHGEGEAGSEGEGEGGAPKQFTGADRFWAFFGWDDLAQEDAGDADTEEDPLAVYRWLSRSPG